MLIWNKPQSRTVNSLRIRTHTLFHSKLISHNANLEPSTKIKNSNILRSNYWRGETILKNQLTKCNLACTVIPWSTVKRHQCFGELAASIFRVYPDGGKTKKTVIFTVTAVRTLNLANYKYVVLYRLVINGAWTDEDRFLPHHAQFTSQNHHVDLRFSVT
jgi:hypothetical protein